MAITFDPPSRPAKVILDTDMVTDCDDAGALAVLHAYARHDQADILAIVANNFDVNSAKAVDAINRYYGRDDIPVGTYQGDEVGLTPHAFVQTIAAASPLKALPGALEVYRAALQGAEDSSVVIASIGHLNNLVELLQSQPDRSSNLPGLELIKRKVAHLVVMGGDYPTGKEHNFFARGSAPFTQRALAAWPTPILFSGFTLGEQILTGPGLKQLPEAHPVRFAYASHGSNPLEKGRPSWDQTAVVVAVQGPGSFWELSAAGINEIESDGSNRWRDDPEGRHFYLVDKVPPKDVATYIETMMAQ